MYKFKNIYHKKVLLCLLSLLTLLANLVSASSRLVKPFTCYQLSNDCKKKLLSLDRYSCDVKIDYDKEDGKLSGECKFYVDNASKCCTTYKCKVHVLFKDSSDKTIFNECSYPYDVKPGATKHVTFMVPRQNWNTSRMISYIYPSIEIVEEKDNSKRCCCLLLIFTFLAIFVPLLIHFNTKKNKV